MTEALARHRRRRADWRNQSGFTLIELLVVIVILGILAAVVVFAVTGVGDKGKSAAGKTDIRTIRTAEEAFCANKGVYASATQLVPGFLSELPKLHNVAVVAGGPCGNTDFTVTCDPADTACGPDGTFPDPNFKGDAANQWKDLTVAGQYVFPPTDTSYSYGQAITRLTDGKILMFGRTGVNPPGVRRWPSYVFDPAASPPWRFVGDLDGTLGPTLPNFAARPRVGTPIALPGGKALVAQFRGYGHFDGNSWSDVNIDWTGAVAGGGQPRYAHFAAPGLALRGPTCGTHCGKVLILGQRNNEPPGCNDCSGGPAEGATAPPIAELYDPVSNRFDAVDCPYDPTVGNGMARIQGGGVNFQVNLAPLGDGRVMLLGLSSSFLPMVQFFDPTNLRLDNADPFTCDGPTPWTDPADPAMDPDAPKSDDGSGGLEGIFMPQRDTPVLLADGRILIGSNNASGNLNAPQIYDPSSPCASGSCRWSFVMGAPCDIGGTNVCPYLGGLAPDGSVYANMGSNNTGAGYNDTALPGGYLADTSVYRLDTTTNPATWTQVGSLNRAYSAGAGVWVNNRLLVTGNQSAEIFTP